MNKQYLFSLFLIFSALLVVSCTPETYAVTSDQELDPLQCRSLSKNDYSGLRMILTDPETGAILSNGHISIEYHQVSGYPLEEYSDYENSFSKKYFCVGSDYPSNSRITVVSEGYSSSVFWWKWVPGRMIEIKVPLQKCTMPECDSVAYYQRIGSQKPKPTEAFFGYYLEDSFYLKSGDFRLTGADTGKYFVGETGTYKNSTQFIFEKINEINGPCPASGAADGCGTEYYCFSSNDRGLMNIVKEKMCRQSVQWYENTATSGDLMIFNGSDCITSERNPEKDYERCTDTFEKIDGDKIIFSAKVSGSKCDTNWQRSEISC